MNRGKTGITNTLSLEKIIEDEESYSFASTRKSGTYAANHKKPPLPIDKNHLDLLEDEGRIKEEEEKKEKDKDNSSQKVVDFKGKMQQSLQDLMLKMSSKKIEGEGLKSPNPFSPAATITGEGE